MWWLLAFGTLTDAGIWSHLRDNKRRKIWEKALHSCGFQMDWRTGPHGVRQAFGVRAGSPEVWIEDVPGRTVIVVPGSQALSGVILRHEIHRPPEAPKL